LIEDDFEQHSNDKFEMQASHQTYHHLKDYHNNNSAKSSGKKSAVISSYPASQTHMNYSMFNQSSQNHQTHEHSRQQQPPFNPIISHPEQSRISQQSSSPNSSILIYQL
jgi:hypothetical protein